MRDAAGVASTGEEREGERFFSEDGRWAVENEFIPDDRGQGGPIFSVRDLQTGEVILQLYDGVAEGPVEFTERYITMSLQFWGGRFRLRIDVPARTFVLHPHDRDEPLTTLRERLVAATAPGGADALQTSSQRGVLRWLMVAGSAVFVLMRVVLLLSKTMSPVDRLKAIGCIVFFGAAGVAAWRG